MRMVVLGVGGLLIGLVMLFGLNLLVKGVRNVAHGLGSRSWPRVAGKVTGTEVERDVVVSRDRRSASVTWDPTTSIRYVVDGQEHTTTTLHFGQTLGSSDRSDALLQSFRFPPGKKVQVAYRPGDPATAVLNPGLHPDAFWLVGAGLAFLLPALLCLFLLPAMAGAARPDPAQEAFGRRVHETMERAKRGEAVDLDLPPPPRMAMGGGDRVGAAGAALFGAVALGLGLLAVTVGLQRLAQGRASERWPVATGEVVHSGAREDAREDEPSDPDPLAEGHVVYRYEVEGEPHFNNVRSFAKVGSGGDIEAVRARYRKGARVEVRYSPTDPDVSALEAGNAPLAWLIPGIGAVLLLFGMAVFRWVVPGMMR
jgi:hypothetical protein